MLKEDAAEWLLRRVVAPERSAELIGDYMETHPASGMLRFWLTILWLLLVFSWQTLLGILLSPMIGALAGWYVFAAAASLLKQLDYTQPDNWQLANMTYLIAGMLAWGMAAFFLLRFGYRSAVTRGAAIVAYLASLSAACCWLVPYGKIISASAFVVFIAAYACRAKGRRVLAVLALAWITALLSAYLSLRLTVAAHSLPAMRAVESSLFFLYLQFLPIYLGAALTAILFEKRLLQKNNPEAPPSAA